MRRVWRLISDVIRNIRRGWNDYQTQVPFREQVRRGRRRAQRDR